MLLQQAEMLSSLAVRVHTDTSQQRLDSAWKVLSLSIALWSPYPSLSRWSSIPLSLYICFSLLCISFSVLSLSLISYLFIHLPVIFSMYFTMYGVPTYICMPACMYSCIYVQCMHERTHAHVSIQLSVLLFVLFKISLSSRLSQSHSMVMIGTQGLPDAKRGGRNGEKPVNAD